MNGQHEAKSPKVQRSEAIVEQSWWLMAGAKVLHWIELARQRRRLASLSDEALKDLGLSRADAMQESQRHFWDDPLSR